MTRDELWHGMPRFTDMGIDDNGEVFFIEQGENSAAADSSLAPESSDLIIGRCSPNSITRDLLEVDAVLGASRTDAATLASHEQTWKATLDATGLKDEGRVDIPIEDDP
ncbi:hypothetical protein Dimus_001070, partial [Dionaea muscipula]